ncbi:MAG TPA: efflux RND transporter periplasmic adaptor subunit, partial [Burkholderiaceae bacterium]
MKRSTLAVLLAAGVALASGGYLAGRFAGRSVAHAPAPAASAPERTVLYWHDPMVPGTRFDKPGKSPFMDMPLVPVYADAAGGAGVPLAPALQQNLGIRTAKARRVEAAAPIDAVGTVQFDERLTVAVQTRVAGYVERLAVRAPMERVRKGQALATVYAPDWLGPLGELVALERAGAASELVAAARERTRALSIPPELVREAERSGTAQARFTLAAPADGVVAELGVREGMAVAPGATLFRIAGLGRVWAVAEVPEAQAVRLVRGQPVQARLQADAAQRFEGRLAEILPEVSATTRTLKARFEVDNRAGRLTPGMLLRLQIAVPAATRLVVPAEAVIRTGRRALVIVRRDGGFEPRDVRLGDDLGDTVEVTDGLAEGDEVVASGQFLIDSEASLRALPARLAAPAAPAASAASATSASAAGAGSFFAEG